VDIKFLKAELEQLRKYGVENGTKEANIQQLKAELEEQRQLIDGLVKKS